MIMLSELERALSDLGWVIGTTPLQEIVDRRPDVELGPDWIVLKGPIQIIAPNAAEVARSVWLVESRIAPGATPEEPLEPLEPHAPAKVPANVVTDPPRRKDPGIPLPAAARRAPKLPPVTEQWADTRPETRADCIGRPRPCPWVGCKYNMLLDVREETGSIILNAAGDGPTSSKGRTRRLPVISGKALAAFRGAGARRLETFQARVIEELEKAAETGRTLCALDMVEGGETYTLDEIGEFLNLSRERVRQIEEQAMDQLKKLGGL